MIGCGGMGIVLKAYDAALNRYSAIKVLATHYASSTAARQRFARESRATAAVIHDNVIAIHGVSEYNGLPYLVMPYVKGESLQKRINRTGRMTVEEILRISIQTARGLAAAHNQGLVHRDIKPGNILLPLDIERVMITDFGLARAADDASLTRSGLIAGTPQYMSPEQARGDGLDSRSDLFSLGSVMYAICTGEPPFQAETPYGVLRKITDSVARPVREINPDVPHWLSAFAEALKNEELDFCTIASQPGSLFEKPGFGLPLKLDEADREDLANQIKDIGSDYDEILIVRGSNDSRTETHLFVVASPEQTLALATRIMDVMVKQQQAREAKSHEELFAD